MTHRSDSTSHLVDIGNTFSLKNSEVFFLLLNYLRSEDGFEDISRLLEEKMESQSILGQTIGWDGTSRKLTVDDYTRLYNRIPKNQLEIHLKNSLLSLKQIRPDLNTSLFHTFNGNYDPSSPTMVRAYTNLSTKLVELVGRKHHLNFQLNRKKSRIHELEASKAKDMRESQGSIDKPTWPSEGPPVADIVTSSPNRQVLKSLGEEKELVSLTKEKEKDTFSFDLLNVEISSVLSELGKIGCLSSGVCRGDLDSGLSWLSARRMGVSSFRTSNLPGLGAHFTPSSCRVRMLLESKYRLLWTTSGHMLYPAYCLVFDRSGKFIITGADDYLVKIWDVASGQLVKTCKGHLAYVTYITVSPDNSIFASGCTKGTIRVWKLSTGECLQVLRHKSAVNWLKFDLTSNTLASGSDDGHCIVWDLSKLLPAGKIDAPLWDLLYRNQDEAHQTGYTNSRPNNGASRELDQLQDENHHVFRGSSTRLNNLLISSAATHSTMPTGGFPQDSRGDPGARGSRRAQYQSRLGHSYYASPTGLSTRPGLFAWSRSIPGIDPSLDPHDDSDAMLILPHIQDVFEERQDEKLLKVQCLDISPLGGILVTGCEDGVARVWRFGDLESKSGYSMRAPKRNSLQMLREMVSPNEYARMERVATHLLLRLEGHVASITDIHLSKQGDRVLSCSSSDGNVRIWSLSSDYSKSVHIVLNLKDEDQDSTRNIRVRGRAAAHKTRSKTQVYNVCWSCDDARVVTIQNVVTQKVAATMPGLHPTRLKVWNSMNGDLLAVIRSISNVCARVLIPHPTNPSVVMTSGEDGLVNVWDVDDERRLSSAKLVNEEGLPSHIVDASFSEDGTYIAVSDTHGRLSVLGLEDPERYRGRVLYEQYFSSDYASIIEDNEGFAIDMGTQLPVIQAPTGLLCNLNGTPYPQQPPLRIGPQPLPALTMEKKLLELEERKNFAIQHFDWIFSCFQRDRFRGRVPKKYKFHKKSESFYDQLAKPSSKTVSTGQNILLDSRGYASSSTDSDNEGTGGWGRSPSTARIGNTSTQRSLRDRSLRQVSYIDEDDEAFEEDTPYDRGSSFSGRRLNEAPTRSSADSRAARAANREARRRHFIADEDEEDEEEDDDEEEDEDNYEDEGEYTERRYRTRGRRNRLPRDLIDDSSSHASEDEEMEGLEEELNELYDSEEERPRISQRRRTLRRRHRRRTANGSSSSLVNITSSSTSSAGRTSSRPRANRNQSPPHHNQSVPLGLLIDRSWLQADKTNDCQYAPQKGDRVIYFPQGHIELLNSFSESSAPPWHAFPQKYPLVECQVENIHYEFPTKQEYKQSTSIVAILDLVVLQIPTKHMVQSSMFQYHLELAPPRTTRHSSHKAIQFQVRLRNCHVPDFIIPSHIVLRAIAFHWYRGIPIHVNYKEANEDGEISFRQYKGTVVGLSNSSPDWPNSFWESFEVTWDDDLQQTTSLSSNTENTIDRIGPWEAVPSLIGESFEEFHWESATSSLSNQYSSPRIVSEETERIEKAIQELMETQRDDFAPFEFEVDSELFPEYYSLIPVPIYIDLILRRLRNGYYRQSDALEFDIELLYENCIFYNAPGTPIVEAGQSLRDALLDILHNHPGTPKSSSLLLAEDENSDAMLEFDEEEESIQLPIDEREASPGRQTRQKRTQSWIDTDIPSDTKLSPMKRDLSVPVSSQRKRTRASDESENSLVQAGSVRRSSRHQENRLNQIEEGDLESDEERESFQKRLRSRQKSPPTTRRATLNRDIGYKEIESEEDDDVEDVDKEKEDRGTRFSKRISSMPVSTHRTRSTGSQLKGTLRRGRSSTEVDSVESSQEEEEEESDDSSSAEMASTRNFDSRRSHSSKSKNTRRIQKLGSHRPTLRSKQRVRYGEDSEEDDKKAEEKEEEEEEEEEEDKPRRTRRQRESFNSKQSKPSRGNSSHNTRRSSRDPELHSKLQEILSYVRTLDESGEEIYQEIFAEPVTEDIAPGYFDIVLQPMDLSTISRRINSQFYRSVEDLVEDLRLMYANCELYNGASSLLGKEAIRQRKKMESFIRKFK